MNPVLLSMLRATVLPVVKRFALKAALLRICWGMFGRKFFPHTSLTVVDWLGLSFFLYLFTEPVRSVKTTILKKEEAPLSDEETEQLRKDSLKALEELSTLFQGMGLTDRGIFDLSEDTEEVPVDETDK